MSILTLTPPAAARAVVPNEGVLDMLKTLLAKAEAGELQQLAFAGINADGSASTGFVGSGATALLGAATRLQFRLSEALA